ncbi:MaoC/PaaZ C-terminal domain-containing protein [Williamsia muralis]|uniref:MaoC/PaaZ C-terminal domain-containing protein n=1 Tax=Williamsia marianensis TaxID=85044 RepID=UPI0037FC91E3
MSTHTQKVADWIGHQLGSRTIEWNERDAILFALAVGAQPDSELDLVYERALRVLPTFGLTLGQWAPDMLGWMGAFPVDTSLHVGQRIVVHNELPAHGQATLAARVDNVWDKGSAAIFEVSVNCEFFTAVWSIFAPGCGGFGGERGPSVTTSKQLSPVTTVRTADNSAALYRLCGDRHAIHIDPAAARAIGQDRPVLHGLATLSASALGLARYLGKHPADLAVLSGRFRSMVFPGADLQIAIDNSRAGGFVVSNSHGVIIDDALATFRDV